MGRGSGVDLANPGSRVPGALRMSSALIGFATGEIGGDVVLESVKPPGSGVSFGELTSLGGGVGSGGQNLSNRPSKYATMVNMPTIMDIMVWMFVIRLFFSDFSDIVCSKPK